MSHQRTLAAALACMTLSTLATGAEAFRLELEPDATKGYRGAVELHVWVTGPGEVSEVHFDLRIQAGLVAETSLVLDDRFKGPGLSAQARVEGDIASADVVFDPERRPPSGERTDAFVVRFCLESPTPFAGWTFPVEVLGAAVQPAGSPEPVEVATTVAPISVLWGASHASPMPCYHEPLPPEFVNCVTQPDGSVLLTWSNPEVYDQIQIHTTRQNFLPGDATSWLHAEGGVTNNFVYEIEAIRSTGEERPRHAEKVRCTAEDPRQQVKFVRGDVNADGALSTADMIALQRWALSGEYDAGCADAADVDDDGRYSFRDLFVIAYYLFGTPYNFQGGLLDPGEQPPEPFPGAGVDPTHAGEERYMTCERYAVSPPEATDDVIRIGDVEAVAGGEAYIPVYLTNDRPVEAVQLVIQYDPTVLRILPGPDSLSFEGSYYEQFFGQWLTYTDDHQTAGFVYRRPDAHVDVHEGEGVLTAAVIGHMVFPRILAIPPGQDTLVARIRVEVSPDVPPGTILNVDPADGPDGSGHGRFHLRNELTYQGDANYVTILPRHVGGLFRIGVDGDVSFFRRGDANGDQLVDLSDAVTILGYLFVGAETPDCLDAADADDSGDVLITDAIVILTHLFAATGNIAPPYPEPGVDPRPDFLERCRR